MTLRLINLSELACYVLLLKTGTNLAFLGLVNDEVNEHIVLFSSKVEIIRIYHKCGIEIEKFVPRITLWLHEA